MRVADLMSRDVVCVGADTSLRAVARLFVERSVGAAPVVDDDERLVGMLTEADLVRLELHQDPVRHLRPVAPVAGRAPRTAGEAMTRDVWAVTPDADVADVARRMVADGWTRVPVVEAGRVVGLVSRSDLVRLLVRDDADVAAELALHLADVPGDWLGDVRDGRVTLRRSGTAPVDAAAAGLAERTAWTVPGVVAVRRADG